MKSKTDQNQFKTFLTWSKNHFAFLGILLTLIVSGCNNDSNSSHASIVDGQWKLTHISGSFAGVSSDFAPGVITWNFNPTTQTATVLNNNTDNNLTDLFETGVYNYQIIQSQNPDVCSETLKIDGVEMGCFAIVNSILQIDQSFVDGYTATLVP